MRVGMSRVHCGCYSWQGEVKDSQASLTPLDPEGRDVGVGQMMVYTATETNTQHTANSKPNCEYMVTRTLSFIQLSILWWHHILHDRTTVLASECHKF